MVTGAGIQVCEDICCCCFSSLGRRALVSVTFHLSVSTEDWKVNLVFDPVTVSDVIQKEEHHPSTPGTDSSSQEPGEDVCVSETLSPPATISTTV